MNTTAYTPKLAADVADGGRFISVLSSAHLDKRIFANAIAEAFINGMNTQTLLTARPQPAPEAKQEAGQESA